MTPSAVKSSLLLVGALLVLGSCGRFKSWLLDEEPSESKKDPKAATEAEGTTGAADSDGGSFAPEPLVRSDRKLRFTGKSAEHMGFSLPKLAKLHALAGAVEVPEWSDPGAGAPRLVRDDDLRTTWTCALGPESTCAIGIHFPEPAEIVATRIYSADPGTKNHARPKLVRVHTDEGWAEVRLSDEDGLWHLQLGEPVKTRNLTLEVMETYSDAPVHLAELEIYGRSGQPRAPLVVDMSRRAVSFDPPVWRKKSRTHTAGIAYVEQIDIDGRAKRLLPGTALVGKSGDRLLLLERASWSTCGDHQGGYLLLDTQTRVLVPLGDMGAFAAGLFRHDGGLGFAVGVLDRDNPRVQGIIFDESKYARRGDSRLDRREPHELLASWGISDAPLSRADALPLSDPPEGCGPADAKRVKALGPHLPKRSSTDAAVWTECSLVDGASLLVSTEGKCGKKWHVAVLDGDGEITGVESGKESGTHLRLRRIDAETLMVEQWGDKDSPRLFHADSGRLVQVEGTLGLSLRPPAGCREQCGVEFSDLGPGT